MFKNTYQSGLLTIFYSCGSNPLSLWDLKVQNGHIKRVTDNEINSIVLEVVSTNITTTYITCPKNNISLGIKLPFLIIILKNLKRYFSFEIVVLDNKNMRRRFNISNFQSTTKIRPFCTTMPIALSGGWNQIQFNLSDFTHRAYGSKFTEVVRVQVHANTRLRRIYFSDRLYSEDELPHEYKLFLPLQPKQRMPRNEQQRDEAASKRAPIKFLSKVKKDEIDLKTIRPVKVSVSEHTQKDANTDETKEAKNDGEIIGVKGSMLDYEVYGQPEPENDDALEAAIMNEVKKVSDETVEYTIKLAEEKYLNHMKTLLAEDTEELNEVLVVDSKKGGLNTYE